MKLPTFKPQIIAMKVIYFLFLMVPVSVFSQNGEEDMANPNRLPFKDYSLNAELTAPNSIRFPFSAIKIIDSRFDTSFIGFDYNVLGGKRTSFKKMRLKGGNASAIEKYYNDYYKNSFDSSIFSLVIVIKKFWVSLYDYDANKQLVMHGNRNISRRIPCKWEYYLCKNEEYLPIKRIDTIWKLNADISQYIDQEFGEKRQQFIKFALKAMIEMLDYSKAIAVFEQQAKKSMNEINEYNSSRFTIPVLIDDNISKGVFLNFTQFRNNKPGIIKFREDKTKYKLVREEIYIEDENGKQINPYWGYFDGAGFKFGIFGNNKLFRGQNSFYFFIKTVTFIYSENSTVVQQNAIRFNTKTRSELWIPFQVDMETGGAY